VENLRKREPIGRLTGSDPIVTDYVLEMPARCLRCGAEINEKTLVEWCDPKYESILPFRHRVFWPGQKTSPGTIVIPGTKTQHIGAFCIDFVTR
jgi:hypothetical protein